MVKATDSHVVQRYVDPEHVHHLLGATGTDRVGSLFQHNPRLTGVLTADSRMLSGLCGHDGA